MPKKKNPKIDLITKVLAELESPDDFPVWIVVVENKKLTKDLQIILMHIYDRDRLEFQGSITVSIEEDNKKMSKYKVGESDYCVLTFSGREKNILEKAKDFIGRSFSEGKIQDFLPF
ncbi:MAG: hypothetical protein R3F48_17420 [Candidatus Zixiibacteriota bacterium]